MGQEAGLNVLQKCPLGKISRFLHSVIDGVCGRRPPSHADFADDFDLEQWWQALDVTRGFIRDAVKNDWDREKMTAELDAQLDPSFQQSVLDAISVRRTELRTSLVNQTCAVSHLHLQDFDWQLKLALSSDKLSSIQEPLVTVNMDIHQDDSSKSVGMELNRDELRTLINSLEAANKVMTQLKTS